MTEVVIRASDYEPSAFALIPGLPMTQTPSSGCPVIGIAPDDTGEWAFEFFLEQTAAMSARAQADFFADLNAGRKPRG